MIFNSTLFYALTISNFYDHSPLITLSQLAKDSSFQMKEFKLSNFFNNALKVNQLLQDIYVDRSKFSNFLNSVIVIQSEDCDIRPPQNYINMQMVLIKCTVITNSSFDNIDVSFDNGAISCTQQNKEDYFIVDHCNFTTCKSKSKGGAIYFVGSQNCSHYNAITYCNFIGCYVNSGGNAQVSQTIDSNDGFGYGGSVYCETSRINFRNSVFNSSKIFNGGYGGAIYANVTDVNDTTFFTSFYNCTIEGDNSFGGAIYINLTNKGFYNMSYMTFDGCNAANGQCIYAENIDVLNINYTRIYNIDRNVFMAKEFNFNFSLGTIILNDTIDVQLINASEYPNNNISPKRISLNIYARGPFDENMVTPLFNEKIANYCIVFIHPFEEYSGWPVIPPENASLPLEGTVESSPVEVTSTSDEISTPPGNIDAPQESSSDPINTPPTPSIVFSKSQDFTNSEVFSAPAAPVAPAGGGGLSTVAIIFIVIGCLIIILAIIIFVIFYLRSHGRCRCSGDGSLAGMKSSTYF